MTSLSALFRTTCLALPAVLAMTAAQGQEHSGAVTLGLSNGTFGNDDDELSRLSLEGILDADFGNGFTLGTDLGFSRSKINEFDVNATDLRLKPRYRFANGLTAGAYVEHVSFSADGDDLSLTGYGLSLGYQTDTLDVALHVGETESDGGFGGEALSDVGLTLLYTPSEALAVGAQLVRSDGNNDSLETLRLGAVHALNGDWTVFGGLDFASIDDTDFTTFGIGASYSLASVFGRPAALSFEYERTSLDGGFGDSDLDTLRLGLTIPLGPTGVQEPINSTAHLALRPRHNALPTLVASGFLF
jgi:hypothetical protein